MSCSVAQHSEPNRIQWPHTQSVYINIHTLNLYIYIYTFAVSCSTVSPIGSDDLSATHYTHNPWRSTGSLPLDQNTPTRTSPGIFLPHYVYIYIYIWIHIFIDVIYWLSTGSKLFSKNTPTWTSPDMFWPYYVWIYTYMNTSIYWRYLLLTVQLDRYY